MELWLVRHANAESVSADGSDERRALDAEGRAQFARSVAGLERLGVSFDRILFSPLLRAQETAEILQTVCTGECEAVLELAEPPTDALMERVLRIDTDHTALVGHEPWLSQLAAWLMFGWRVYDAGPAARVLALEKGGVVHLAGTPRPGGMTLIAAYPPSALRKLARR